MNSLGTIVCESMFIAIYTTPKIQLNPQHAETEEGPQYNLYCGLIYSCLRNKR